MQKYIFAKLCHKIKCKIVLAKIFCSTVYNSSDSLIHIYYRELVWVQKFENIHREVAETSVVVSLPSQYDHSVPPQSNFVYLTSPYEVDWDIESLQLEHAFWFSRMVYPWCYPSIPDILSIENVTNQSSGGAHLNLSLLVDKVVEWSETISNIDQSELVLSAKIWRNGASVYQCHFKGNGGY